MERAPIRYDGQNGNELPESVPEWLRNKAVEGLKRLRQRESDRVAQAERDYNAGPDDDIPQRPGPGGRPQSGRRPEGRNGGFDESAPKVGDPLPDVTAVDADGNEFKLSSLKGHYTVLVFGCLT